MYIEAVPDLLSKQCHFSSRLVPRGGEEVLSLSRATCSTPSLATRRSQAAFLATADIRWSIKGCVSAASGDQGCTCDDTIFVTGSVILLHKEHLFRVAQTALDLCVLSWRRCERLPCPAWKNFMLASKQHQRIRACRYHTSRAWHDARGSIIKRCIHHLDRLLAPPSPVYLPG